MTYQRPLKSDITFGVMAKMLPTEGNMAWEYNPFRNYRLSEGKYFFRDKYYSAEELVDELCLGIVVTIGTISIDDNSPKKKIENYYPIEEWDNQWIMPTEEDKSWSRFKFTSSGTPASGTVVREYEYTVKVIDDSTDEEIETTVVDTVEYNYILNNCISTSEEDPIFYDTNELVDFDTDELNFDLSHPVDITAQYSYDGSVNLILNDGKNSPKLINSRFSALGRNKYQIVDRKGDNDTNIYDQGEQFETDTSLYKTYTKIPELEFISVYQSGQLPVGNYHFYFRYADRDGNETDIIAESGLVSIFKGNVVGSIHTGFRNENSGKSVKFIIENADTAYDYVHVYFTRSSADINENETVTAHRIDLKYLVNNAGVADILITGNEPTFDITVEEVNPKYLIAENVFTQAQCQNMLFFGNITDQYEDYKEFTDLSLRFLAIPDNSLEYNNITHDYDSDPTNTYADPNYIYKYVGYQNKEIYRFGIVFIKNNGNLSAVYNIRGRWFDGLGGIDSYNHFPLYLEDTGNETRERNYIAYNETTGILYGDSISENNKESGKSEDDDGYDNATSNLENAYGVVRIDTGTSNESSNVIGIKIVIDNECQEDLYPLLQKLGVKGFFFVRQKRMPLRLAQGYVIGADSESNIPMPYVASGDGTILVGSDKENDVSAKESEINDRNPLSLEYDAFIAERFLTSDKILDHDFTNRLFAVQPDLINKYCIICPEYDVNSPYLNSIFCGDEFIVEQICETSPLKQDELEKRHFYVLPTEYLTDNTQYKNTRITGVEDNTKLIEVDNKLFSARAGEAEEAFRYEYINIETKQTDCTNLVRGSFGPFLGINGYNLPGTLVNIYIQDYLNMDHIELFKIRYNDKSPFYAISERYTLDSLADKNKYGEDLTFTPLLYRGDTYICQFTHRFNRNFQDPSAPTNHKIVDPKCWYDNFEIKDGVVTIENFEKINLGDVNAIKIGMWISMPVVSTFNLNVRSLDESYPDETALNGHARGFYPYYGMSVDGSYKTPEALCINKGFGKSLSERYNFEVPDVPFIKNDFTNRVAFSNVAVNDSALNGFRTFVLGNKKDYSKEYGQITKLVNLNDRLLVVFEHGIITISVKERTVSGSGAGGNLYLNSPYVLTDSEVPISQRYGSQWRDSIIKTDKYIYGVDTIAKVIWRVGANGSGFTIISEDRVQEFLNKSISLEEREIDPLIGIRNVKTHYNAFKGDVMFTFYDNLYGFEEKVWNLCFNENIDLWITFYSWVPSFSENIYNQFFSFDRNTSKWIAKLGVSHTSNDFSDGVCLSENVFENTLNQDLNNSVESRIIGKLSLENRTLPNVTGTDITIKISYELVRDIFQNYRNFEIIKKVINDDDTYYYTVDADISIMLDGITHYDKGEYFTVSFTGDDYYDENYVDAKKPTGILWSQEYYTPDLTQIEYDETGKVLDDSKTKEATYNENAEGGPRWEINDNINTNNNIFVRAYWEVDGMIIYSDVYTITAVISQTSADDEEYTTTIDDSTEYYLCVKKNVTGIDFCSEIYKRGTKDTSTGEYTLVVDNPNDNKTKNTDGLTQYDLWLQNCVLTSNYVVYKNDRGIRVNLDEEKKRNANRIVILLNIRANISVSYDTTTPSLQEYVSNNYENGSYVDAGYYESVVAVMPVYNMQFLTTDFWKHGQSGIIDIADKIRPTYWYGKQHPMEFEFVVNDTVESHKIFDNLQIIANNAEPESFHYEIVGDSYQFSNDKKNMYIRQEATKELFQYNGMDIEYDDDYTSLTEEQRPINNLNGLYDKSTLFPLYYYRLDDINDIEDYYHLKDGAPTKDFSRNAGAEIVHYDKLDEYRIWNHSKAVSITDDGGRLRGNMHYRNDEWYAQINPITIVLKNESEWENGKVPVELNQYPLPEYFTNYEYFEIPEDMKERAVTQWRWDESEMREVKPKDKWIKIRIRYTGDKLAIIHSVKTLFSISEN